MFHQLLIEDDEGNRCNIVVPMVFSHNAEQIPSPTNMHIQAVHVISIISFVLHSKTILSGLVANVCSSVVMGEFLRSTAQHTATVVRVSLSLWHKTSCTA